MDKKPSVILPLYVRKSKGKVIPVQAWTGTEFFRRLGLPDYKTIGHEGGKVLNPNFGRLYLPGNIVFLLFIS
jgi:hypothetical protein